MNDQSSLTARMAAFARAYHTENNQSPVFRDTIAHRLFSEDEYRSIREYTAKGITFFAPEKKSDSETAILKYVVDTQLAPTPLARARYCEESLRTAVKTGTKQYVILGAGLDTFAWREPELMKRLAVFEVDHPLTQKDKKERLARAGLSVPHNLHFVPVDFLRDDLKAALIRQGFDETKKTFLSWLGVSYYLSAEAIGVLLDSLSSFLAEGSTLLFDYADDGLFAAPQRRVKNMVAMAAAGGEPMKFCASPLQCEVLLGRYHFLTYEHLLPEDIQYRYFDGRTDGMSAFEHIGYILAVLKGAPFINTKEKILQTALKLFAEKGYEAVSVKDIADDLGIAKSALYKHYANKRDIFESIVCRMEEEDTCSAASFNMPVGTTDTNADDYCHIRLQSLIDYTAAQFRYWTENPFACRFRRLLTLEQYHDAESTALYQQYLGAGPLLYVRDIFAQMIGNADKALQEARAFYAPVFLLYSLYDGAENKSGVAEQLQQHLKAYADRLIKGEYDYEVSTQ